MRVQNRWNNWLAAAALTAVVPAFLGAQAPAGRGPLIDVQSYEIKVTVEPERSFLNGEARLRFRVLGDSLALPFDFNRKLSLLRVTDEEQNILSIRGEDVSRDRIRVQADQSFESGTERTLTFEFEGMLERDQYAFLDVPFTGKAVIDPQGAVLLSESNWFPSSFLPTDPATASVSVTVPLGFTAVAPGVMQPVETVGISEVFTWTSERPVTRLPVFVSRYFRQSFGTEGPLPVTFFVNEDFRGDLKPWVDEIEKIAAFMIAEFGDPPVTPLTLAQIGRMQVTSLSASGLIPLESGLLDSHTLPLMELTKRVAHQWWGNSLQMKRGSDAWLEDGFATFEALRYIEKNYPDRYEAELAKLAVEGLKYQETAPVTSGIDLEVGSAKYNSIVGAKGAWILFMLGQLIGKEELNGVIAEFYRSAAGDGASTGTLLELVNQKSGQDYRWFFVQWVESVGVPEFELDYTIFKVSEGGFVIRGQVKQNLELFRMPMDILIETKGKPEEKRLNVSGKATSFSFETETLPVRLVMDPKGKVLMDSEKMRVAVHVALGEEYQDQGEYVSAVDEFEKAVKLNPRSSLAHFRLGQTFFDQHSYSNAANSLRDSLNGDLKPEWVETWAHIYLGKVYDILGQRQRALAEYQKALNSKIDYEGAQAEAQKYLDEPYTKPDSVLNQ